MSLVLDASMAVAWCLRDEASPGVQGVLNRIIAEGCHVPALWAAELANALLAAEWRKRLLPGELEQAAALFDDVNISVDHANRRAVLSGVVPLAREYGLSVYDAAYLELAVRLGVGIATLDGHLAAAAGRRGVEVATV